MQTKHNIINQLNDLRKHLLVNGIAVREDIDATRARAVDAYARLLAFQENG